MPEDQEDHDDKCGMLGRFVHDLEMMLLKEGPEGLTEAKIDQDRLADVIARTAVFVGEVQGGESSTKEKLMSYYSAIRDLSDGIIHPIFRATKTRGAPPPSSEVWRSRATVAVALDYFIKAKISFDEAFKKIKKVPGIPKLVKKGGDLSSSVRNWRTILDDGSAQNYIALERWKASRENFAKFDALDEMSRNALLSVEAERLLKVAADEIALIVSPTDSA
jgi:hypothetical protein